jgi:hypothetical protein
MKSGDLIQHGFANWLRFNRAEESTLLTGLPSSPAVYVLRDHAEHCRWRGRSDIYYIGSATNTAGLKWRIRNIFHPGGKNETNQRILREITAFPTHEMAYVETTSPQMRRH